MEATTVMKFLVLNMLLLAVAVQAYTALPPSSQLPQPQGYGFPSGSPSIDSPPPSPLVDFPPPPPPLPESSLPSPSLPPPAPLLPQTPPLPQFPPPLLPQTPPLPQFPPPEVDPVSPPPLSCSEKCAMKCAEKVRFSRLICYGLCLAKCAILPWDHASYHCTRDCVLISLHHQPSKNILADTKNLDGLVHSCYTNCTKDS